MTDLVRDLATYLCAQRRSAPDVDAALAARHITGARVANGPDGAPYTVAIPLASPVAIADLQAAFGAYKTLERTAPGEPWPLLFHDAVKGPGARVSLLVEAPGPLANVAAARASRVTLRIDPP